MTGLIIGFLLVCMLNVGISGAIRDESGEVNETSPETGIVGIFPIGGITPQHDVIPPQHDVIPHRHGNQRPSFYQFWRSISKNVVPMLSFLQKAITSLLEKYCMLLRQTKKMRLRQGCMDLGEQLAEMTGDDFPESASKAVLAVEGTEHFEKNMFVNVIRVLEVYDEIFDTMVKYEHKRYCLSKNTTDCAMNCQQRYKTEIETFICEIKTVVLSNIHRLTHDLNQQGRQYFKVKIHHKVKSSDIPRIPVEPWRRYFNLMAAYKFLEQTYETQSSLEYILMALKDKNFKEERVKMQW